MVGTLLKSVIKTARAKINFFDENWTFSSTRQNSTFKLVLIRDCRGQLWKGNKRKFCQNRLKEAVSQLFWFENSRDIWLLDNNDE